MLCLAFAKNFTDLMIIRTLQGFAECTTYPALLIMTASWYTTREHAMRLVIWGTANAGMDVLTSLINYGIGMRAVQDRTGLAPWKGISIFLGSLTILMSVVVFFIFSTPRDCRWLSAQERRMAQARIVSSQTGSDAQKRYWDWNQVQITFKDPQTYFFFFISIINSIPNGGLTSFGNLVYVSFGFSSLGTIVKGTIPRQLLSIVWFVIAGYITLQKPGLRCNCVPCPPIHSPETSDVRYSLLYAGVYHSCLRRPSCTCSSSQGSRRSPLDALGLLFHHIIGKYRQPSHVDPASIQRCRPHEKVYHQHGTPSRVLRGQLHWCASLSEQGRPYVYFCHHNLCSHVRT